MASSSQTAWLPEAESWACIAATVERRATSRSSAARSRRALFSATSVELPRFDGHLIMGRWCPEGSPCGEESSEVHAGVQG